ncbi:MAG: YbaN family protein [Paenalcaligenes sp.]
MTQPPAPPPSDQRAQSALLRVCWFILAVCSFILAIIGVILPGMPTTVFVLISAWAAARSSPRFHQWLMNHRIFGPSLHNWQNGRLVTKQAKWTALVSMSVCAVLLLWLAPHWWISTFAISCMLCVLLWLWSRPEPPTQKSEP